MRSGGLLDIGQLSLLNSGGTSEIGSIFIDDATVNAGSLTPVFNVGIYLGIDNGGTFTTTGGTAGDRWSFAINLDRGGQYLGVGDTVFGGDDSLFTLGPGIQDLTPTTSGLGEPINFEPDTQGNWDLLQVARAFTADRAMNAITDYRNDGTITYNSGYTFRVDGDASFGGASSAPLLFVDGGSSFEVTGNAAMVNGGDSSVDVVVTGGSFTVGNDWSVLQSTSSSATMFFAQSDINVGNDWLLGGGAASVATMNAADSTLDVGGTLDFRLGNGSASDVHIQQDVQLNVGGDILLGGAAGSNDGSAFSALFEDSTITADGNLEARVGDSSVLNFVTAGMTIDLGGDLLVSAGDDSRSHIDLQSTTLSAHHLTLSNPGTSSTPVAMTVNMDDVELNLSGDFLIDGPTEKTDLTLGSFALNLVGDNRSHSAIIEDATLDADGDFMIRTTGDQSDSTVVLKDSAGQVDGNFAIRTGADSMVDVAVEDIDVTVGGDVLLGGLADTDSQAMQINTTDSTITAGGSYHASVGDGSAQEHNTSNTTFNLGGDYRMETGGSSSAVYDHDNVTVNADNFEISMFGDSGAQSFRMDHSELNLTGGLLIDTRGSHSDSSIDIRNTTGSVGDSFILAGMESISTSSMFNAVLLDLDLSIGDDFAILSASTASSRAATLGNLNLDIGGDMRIATPAHDASVQSVGIQNTTATVGGDLAFDVSSLNDSAGYLTLDNFTATVGGDARFNLTVDDTSEQTSNATAMNLDITGDFVLTQDSTLSIADSQINVGNDLWVDSTDPASSGTKPDVSASTIDVAGVVDLDGGLLSLSDNSVVSASELLLGSRVRSNSGSELNLGQLSLYEDADHTQSTAGAIFIDDATVNAGFFTPVTGAAFYLGIDNEGTFTTESGGRIDGNSYIVMNIDNGGQYLGVGDTVFGGDTSSFTLSPGVHDLTPTYQGDRLVTFEPGRQGNFDLASHSKAMSADRVMRAIDAYIVPGTGDRIDFELGSVLTHSGYTFRVDGDATFGGASSDNTFLVDGGSTFEVTGNAAMANGGSSTGHRRRHRRLHHRG